MKTLKTRVAEKKDGIVIEARVKIRLILFRFKLWYYYEWRELHHLQVKAEGEEELVFKNRDEAKRYMDSNYARHACIELINGETVHYYNPEQKLTDADFEKLRQITKKL